MRACRHSIANKSCQLAVRMLSLCRVVSFTRGFFGFQVMRHDVSLALGKSGPNVDVMCTDKRFGGRFMAFDKVQLIQPC